MSLQCGGEGVAFLRGFGLFLLVAGDGWAQRPHGAVGVIHHPLDAHEYVGSPLGEHGRARRRRAGLRFDFGNGRSLARPPPREFTKAVEVYDLTRTRTE